MTQFDMLLRYAPHDPERFRRFMSDLADLCAAVRAAERRRLCSDAELFAQACKETAQEIAKQKAGEL